MPDLLSLIYPQIRVASIRTKIKHTPPIIAAPVSPMSLDEYRGSYAEVRARMYAPVFVLSIFKVSDTGTVGLPFPATFFGVVVCGSAGQTYMYTQAGLLAVKDSNICGTSI